MIGAGMTRAMRPTWSPGLVEAWPRRRADHAAQGRLSRGREARQSSRVRRAVTVQTTIVSKKTPRGLLLLGHLNPSCEAGRRSLVGCPGGDRVGLPPPASTSSEGALPAVADADVRSRQVEDAPQRPHHPQHDVASTVTRPGQSTYFSWTAFGPASGHRGDLAGVVGLVAADRDRCRPLLSRTSGTMYSILHLVAAVANPLLTSSRLARSARRRGVPVSRSGCGPGSGRRSAWYRRTPVGAMVSVPSREVVRRAGGSGR